MTNDAQLLYWQRRLGIVSGRQPHLLSLQDPADMTNDLTKSTHKIAEIQKLFRTLAKVMEKWLEDRDSMSALDSPLDVFFERGLNRLDAKREISMRYARRLGMSVKSDEASPQKHDLRLGRSIGGGVSRPTTAL